MQLRLLIQLITVVAHEIQLGKDGLVIGPIALETVEVLPVYGREGLDEITLLVER